MLQSEAESPHISQLYSLNSYMQSSARAIDVTKKKKQKKRKTKQSDGEHRHHNLIIHLPYHGIFTIFQRHNALSYNSDEKELIIRLLTNCKLVRISPTRSKNAEVTSWWKGS